MIDATLHIHLHVHIYLARSGFAIGMISYKHCPMSNTSLLIKLRRQVERERHRQSECIGFRERQSVCIGFRQRERETDSIGFPTLDMY